MPGTMRSWTVHLSLGISSGGFRKESQECGGRDADGGTAGTGRLPPLALPENGESGHQQLPVQFTQHTRSGGRWQGKPETSGAKVNRILLYNTVKIILTTCDA